MQMPSPAAHAQSVAQRLVDAVTWRPCPGGSFGRYGRRAARTNGIKGVQPAATLLVWFI